MCLLNALVGAAPPAPLVRLSRFLRESKLACAADGDSDSDSHRGGCRACTASAAVSVDLWWRHLAAMRHPLTIAGAQPGRDCGHQRRKAREKPALVGKPAHLHARAAPRLRLLRRAAHRAPLRRASRTADVRLRAPLPTGTAEGRSSRWRPTSPSRALASAATSASWRSCGRKTFGGVRSHAKHVVAHRGPNLRRSHLPASHFPIHPSIHPSIHPQAAARRSSK